MFGRVDCPRLLTLLLSPSWRGRQGLPAPKTQLSEAPRLTSRRTAFDQQQLNTTPTTLALYCVYKHPLLTVCNSLLYTVYSYTVYLNAYANIHKTTAPEYSLEDSDSASRPNGPSTASAYSAPDVVVTGSLPVLRLTVHTGSGAHSRALTPLRNVVTILPLTPDGGEDGHPNRPSQYDWHN